MATTITPDRARELGLPVNHDVVSVDLALGAIDACSHHLRGIGPRVVAYPRTADGKILGGAGHPGVVAEITEEQALSLGWTEREIFEGSGAALGYQRDDGRPCCGECLSTAGEYDEDLDAEEPLGVCWSCVQMIRESWEQSARPDGILEED